MFSQLLSSEDPFNILKVQWLINSYKIPIAVNRANYGGKHGKGNRIGYQLHVARSSCFMERHYCHC